MSKLAGLKNRLPLKIFIPLLAIAVLSIGSYAATVSITTNTYQGAGGVYFNVVGGFTAASNGFVVTQASAVATALPCTWANGGSCTGTTTAGQWQYSVTLTTTASLPATAATYAVVVNWNTGSGYATMGSCPGTGLTVSVGLSTPAGQTMTFYCGNLGTSFTAPLGITVTVQ